MGMETLRVLLNIEALNDVTKPVRSTKIMMATLFLAEKNSVSALLSVCGTVARRAA